MGEDLKLYKRILWLSVDVADLRFKTEWFSGDFVKNDDILDACLRDVIATDVKLSQHVLEWHF